jgi:O-antigen/teichoic acid export membrane protein
MTRPSAWLADFRRWTGTDAPAHLDLSTAERRVRRGRRAVTSTASTLLARGIAVAVGFVAIPLSVSYLGIERYGIFVAVASLATLFAFADLGLGNGLLNLVADAHGRDDREAAARATSSAFFALFGVAALLAIIAALAFSWVDWPAFLNVRGPAASDVGPTVAVIVALFLIGLPLGIVERLRLAYQEGYVTAIYATAGVLLGLVGLLTGVAMQASLPMLVLLVSAPPVIALGANAHRLYRVDRPWLAPRSSQVSGIVAGRLVRIGSMFLLLQIAMVVAFRSDVLVAAAVIGPDAAATYAVTLQFFLAVPALLGAYLVTLWPAYTEALARRDAEWVRETFRRSIILVATISATASGVLVLAGGWLIRAWTGGVIDPPVGLLVGAALWATTMATFNAIAILFNAMSVLAFQVIVAVVMAAASITLSVLFANILGVTGIVWGTLAAYVVFAAVPIVLYLPRLLRQIDSAAASGLDRSGVGPH